MSIHIFTSILDAGAHEAAHEGSRDVRAQSGGRASFADLPVPSSTVYVRFVDCGNQARGGAQPASGVCWAVPPQAGEMWWR